MALDPKDFSEVVKVRGGKQQPDLINSIALRALTKEQAAAEGWTTYYVPQPCANGHTAARFVKNDLCVDCWRVKEGREALYPAAKNRTYYKQRTAQPVANGAPVIVAPATPAALPEPSKVEQKFLAALDETRDFDAAAAAVGWTRGLVESRASSNPVFKTALEDLISRRGIAWTRAPDPETDRWTRELEKQFTRRWVDCGLLEQTRQELKVSASEYHAHLTASPTFAAAISAAEPLARSTLRDRALKEAAAGNDRLLKILEEDAPEPLSNMSIEQMNAEIMKLLPRFLFSNPMLHRPTGQLINFRDLDYEMDSAADSDNSDLVGGT